MRLKLFPIFLIILVSSCQRDNNEVYYNLSFSEIAAIAQTKGKPFCIVLSRGACSACGIYLDQISSLRKGLTGEAIFNIINTESPENKWYTYWACSSASPTTCVFSSPGELIALFSHRAQLYFIYETV